MLPGPGSLGMNVPWQSAHAAESDLPEDDLALFQPDRVALRRVPRRAGHDGVGASPQAQDPLWRRATVDQPSIHDEGVLAQWFPVRTSKLQPELGCGPLEDEL